MKIIWRQIIDATEDFQNKETRARFGGRETRTLCGSVDLVKDLVREYADIEILEASASLQEKLDRAMT